MRKIGLSKSRLALFEQCPRRLWLAVHRPELALDSAATTTAFRVGHDVGELACRELADGRMISSENGLAAAVEETRSLIAAGWNRPLFEATFAHDDVLVRVDLMWPGADGWHIAEVKSSTGLKPYHLSDLATQLWVLAGAGMRVASASIRHLNRAFVLEADGNYHGLFADMGVDAEVAPLVADRGLVVAGARSVLTGTEPDHQPGGHCDAPFACSFKAHCQRGLPPPPAWPTTLLPDASGKALARTWAARGIDDLTLAPPSDLTTERLRRVHAATVSGIPYHDAAAIAAETAGWAFPRIFLDFETIQFAVPRWIGTRPYAQVPFQFSAHVERQDGMLSHHDYLSTDGRDPRRGCAEALAALPATGAVIAWNASFERQCLEGLAARFPDLAPALTSLAARLVDLLPVVRRHYYHRDQRGSWSIKAVLPTLAPELDYATLEAVRSGVEAQAAYGMLTDPSISAEERGALAESLRAYCARDTLAMQRVLARLVAPLGTSRPTAPLDVSGWYNGWSPDERRATSPIQNAAVRDGRLPRPDRCSICSIGDGDEPGNGIWLHDERYDRPLEAYPICRRCHLALHRRFDDPLAWHALVARHRTGGAWFEQLAMDPASRWQPYDTSYPPNL